MKPAVNSVMLGASVLTLGLGIAMCNGTAIAAAETSDSSVGSTASTESKPNTSGPDSENTASNSDNDSVDDSDSTESSTDAEDETDAASTDTDDDAEAKPEEPATDLDVTPPIDSPPTESSPSGDSASEYDADAESPAIVPVEEETVVTVDDGDEDPDSPGVAGDAIEVNAVPTGSDATTPVPLEAAATPASVNLASGVAALSGLTGDTTTPGPITSLLMGLWDWTRRTFFNPGPTVKPVQYLQIENGRVFGTLGAIDPFGEPLRYTVVRAPKYGTVLIEADGGYVYTPSDKIAAFGGTDTFTVRVTQPGFHINLLNLFGNSNRPQVPVTVNLNPVPGVIDEVGSTRGFDIYNASSQPLTFASYATSADDVDSGPAVGTTIQSGEHFHWELTLYGFDSSSVVLHFTTADGGVQEIELIVPAWVQPRGPLTRCDTGTGPVACNSQPDGGQEAWIMDPPGTVIDVSNADPEAQAQVLDRLCQDDSTATCSFTVTRQEDTYTDSTPFGDEVANDGAGTASFTVTSSQTITQSDSVKVAIKEKILFLVEEASQEYSFTWTESKTFSQSITVNLAAYTAGQVFASQPVFRLYGDFTLTLGNSTWNLTDVYFDSPDPSRAGRYDIRTQPIPGSQL